MLQEKLKKEGKNMATKKHQHQKKSAVKKLRLKIKY